MFETIRQLRMKVMNHFDLWDTSLAWYSLSATRRICLYVLEHSLGIHGFTPTWPCSIVEFIASHATNWLLYCDQSNIHLSYNKCFGRFRFKVDDTQSKSSRIRLRCTNNLCGFQFTHGEKQCIAWQCTNYHDTTNHSGCLSRLELLRLCYVDAAK